jgi:hypothetical protein
MLYKTFVIPFGIPMSFFGHGGGSIGLSKRMMEREDEDEEIAEAYVSIDGSERLEQEKMMSSVPNIAAVEK